MKNKKEKKRASLYVYITLSFLAILVLVLLIHVSSFRITNHRLFEKEIPIRELMRDERVQEIVDSVKIATVYSIIIGVALILVMASHIITPLRKITEATKKVATGNLKVKVDVDRKDEIGELAQNFNIMVDELNSIEYLRKDFISNISHELKTPIASIQGFTKLLADDNLSKEEKDEYINIILGETQRLSNLSSNMLKLSKLEKQEIITNKTEYRLDNQIRKAIIMLDEEINKKKIKISLDSGEVSIYEDEDLIMEIWINLINNAIKYSNENGEIKIKVIEEENNVKVSIKDNGIGIPKEKQERIFEKFYQVENSRAGEGSGLGLAIVKRIIDLIKGEIEVESKEKQGTKITVSIPKETEVLVV
ncbi:MAG: sensor histidine kinase [Clostridia bacterium]